MGVSIRMTHSRRLMDLGGFLNALAVFLDSMTSDPVGALISLWYQETRWALDMVAPE